MHTSFRIKGSIYGLLIGNALGTSRPSKFKATTQSVAQLISRNYADSGGMTLCTMSSLIDCDRIDLEDMANLFNEWYIAGYMVSDESVMEGRVSVSKALRQFNNGMPPNRCGSKTNPCDSALMRMLPIALWCLNEPIKEIVEKSHAVTRFTNLNIETEVYSSLFCLLMRGILLQKKGKVPEILEKLYLEQEMKDHATVLNDIRSNSKPETEVGQSFWRAWNAYGEDQSDFEKTMKHILVYNNSTATGIAGAFVGANVGLNDIPQRWLNQIRLPDGSQNVIEKFVKVVTKFGGRKPQGLP